jgi:hypothetical protein
MQDQYNTGLWVLGPRDGLLTVIGVSGRLIKADDEIEAAKLDAARKVGMYYGIQGSFEIVNTTTGSFFDYEANSILNLNYDPDFARYGESLSFNPETDVIRIPGATGVGGAVFVRMRYNAPDLVNINNYSSVKKDSRPTWINNRDLPQFLDYTTAVGFAGKRARLQDTINASFYNAAAVLIQSASSQVTTSETDVAGSGSSSSIHIRSEGSLQNFHVLELWIDPVTGGVYTLAFARVSR